MNSHHVMQLRHRLRALGYDVPEYGRNAGSRLLSAWRDSQRGHFNPAAWNRRNTGTSGPDGPHGPFGPPAHGGLHVIVPRKPSTLPGEDVLGDGTAGPDGPRGPRSTFGPPSAGGKHPRPRNINIRSLLGGGGGGDVSGFGGNSLAGLQDLLKHSGGGHMISRGLADQLAAASLAEATGYQHQLDRLPAAKKDAMQKLSDWFGQVTTAQQHAAANDKAMADAGAASMAANTKGIMDSLGGSAMAGSGSIGAVGAASANTLTAMGANAAMLSGELAPIFKLAEADAKNTRSKQYDQAQSLLTDQLAMAKGRAKSDKAAAIMQIIQANNNTRQQNFSNKAGLLQTMAGLQISQGNLASTNQARRFQQNLALYQLTHGGGKGNGFASMSPGQRLHLADTIAKNIMDADNYDPSAVNRIRNTVFAQVTQAGLNIHNPRIVNTFVNPILQRLGLPGY